MTRANGQSRSLTSALGANCRRIRTEQLGVTQDTLADYARASGLQWNAAKVANFEAGRWTPAFADVLALGIALERVRAFVGMLPGRSAARTHEITLADLLASDVPVTLKPGVMLTGAELADIGRGVFPLPETSALSSPTLAEQRMARALGIDPAQLTKVSERLWGTVLTTERDRRAGTGANQQKRARVTRALRVELEKAITNGND
jgi:hypothetical protein